MAPCASCGTVESPGRKRYATCSHCRSVYYCDKRCQLLHWRDGHKGVCQDRDFAKEAAQSRADESEALQRFMPEIERRLEQREGVGFYRQIAERGFGGGDAAGEAKSSVEEMGGQENGEGRVNE